jgi:phage shock protein C
MKRFLILLMSVMFVFTTTTAVFAESNTQSHDMIKKDAPGEKLHLSKDDVVLAGVCGGIAEHFGWDPFWVRAGWVVLDLIYGIGIPLYIIAWIVMS